MSLSDERLEFEDSYPMPHYLEKDVKEFIKELKKGVREQTNQLWHLELIDKLAGEKLI